VPPLLIQWSAPGWGGSGELTPTALPAQTTTYTLTVTDSSTPPLVEIDTMTVTINPAAGLSYTIVDLGSLTAGPCYPAGINDNGEVVGYCQTQTWQKRAFLYSGGTMTDLGDLGGGEGYARDINTSGQVVGEARLADGRWHAFLWDSAGGTQDLGTLGGPFSTAYAINDAGDVVGYSAVDLVFHAFVYSGGVMGDLGTLSYYQSGAFDINADGHVVGTLVHQAFNSTAFLHDGALVDLGAPLLDNAQAQFINDSGLIAGYAWGPGEERSFLYVDGNVLDIGTLDGFAKTSLYGMADSGQVVGSVSTSDGSLSHAVIWAGGALHDLNDLLVAGHGWDYLVTAFAVNNNGQITGYGMVGGEQRAFLLTPVSP
jgi:probable HAF family extracellular repeat protein